MKPTPLVIPDLGEIVEMVRIVRWLKQVGDTVAVDEEILEISTDKLDVVIQCPAAGVLAEIRSVPGDTVPVGAEVAVIRERAAHA
jgi:pyruvate dehydrogenase E2 component (dihydrolipoamide acetyltransferase)